MGARIRKADGSYGEVEHLEVVQRTQRMYNLTVEVAHTFFVGQERWLVHNSCGFAAGGAADALTGMRSGGGHAIRHLRDAGLVANVGSLESQVAEFGRIVTPILESPAHSFNWKVGSTATRAFVSKHQGTWVAVFVAKEGPYATKVVSAIVPDPNQLATWGIR